MSAELLFDRHCGLQRAGSRLPVGLYPAVAAADSAAGRSDKKILTKEKGCCGTLFCCQSGLKCKFRRNFKKNIVVRSAEMLYNPIVEQLVHLRVRFTKRREKHL